MLLFITCINQLLFIHFIMSCFHIVPLLQGTDAWKTKSIIDLIEKEGDSIALVLFSGNI